VTKAPCGGEKVGRSPVDRGKGGLKRSVAEDGRCIPLGSVNFFVSQWEADNTQKEFSKSLEPSVGRGLFSEKWPEGS
jgi:hypothetical protein